MPAAFTYPTYMYPKRTLPLAPRDSIKSKLFVLKDRGMKFLNTKKKPSNSNMGTIITFPKHIWPVSLDRMR